MLAEMLRAGIKGTHGTLKRNPSDVCWCAAITAMAVTVQGEAEDGCSFMFHLEIRKKIQTCQCYEHQNCQQDNRPPSRSEDSGSSPLHQAEYAHIGHAEHQNADSGEVSRFMTTDYPFQPITAGLQTASLVQHLNRKKKRIIIALIGSICLWYYICQIPDTFWRRFGQRNGLGFH